MVNIVQKPTCGDLAYPRGNLSAKEKIQNNESCSGFFGPSVEIRTRGLLNPIQARYQTSPHPDASVDCPCILAHQSKKSKYFFRLFKKFLFALLFSLNAGVVENTADDQRTAKNLQISGDFAE